MKMAPRWIIPLMSTRLSFPAGLVLAMTGAVWLSLPPSLPAVGEAASDGVYEKGTPVAVFKGKDQHEKEFELAPGVRFLLVSFDMSTGKKANQALAELGGDFLPEHHAVFAANILGMPGIGKFFAFKKMRKYPHRIICMEQEGFTDPFPAKDERVTLLTLAPDLKIETIQYWDPESTPLPELLGAK